MLIETAWKNYIRAKNSKREGYRDSDYRYSVRVAFILFLVVFIVALLVLIPLAIYFTISPDYCGDRIPTWGKILLILLFFTPYAGIFIAIFMVVIGLTTCRRGKTGRPLIASLKS